MKSRKLRMPSPAMIVACMALVLSLAGTSYAAVKINGKNIKNKTISGAKLKKDTLTGTQIKESKLKQVPSAANAANAAALEGTPAAGFARSANFQRVLVSLNVGDPDVTVVTHGDIAVKARCYNDGLKDKLSVYATTQNNGALLETEEDSLSSLNTDTPFDSAEITNDEVNTDVAYSEDGYDETGFVVNAASDKVITLLEGSKVALLNRAGKDCTFGGVFIVN